MHFLQHLLRYMVPIPAMIFNPSHELPAGDDFVITKRNKFVVTLRTTSVIAKAY